MDELHLHIFVEIVSRRSVVHVLQKIKIFADHNLLEPTCSPLQRQVKLLAHLRAQPMIYVVWQLVARMCTVLFFEYIAVSCQGLHEKG